MIDYLYGLEYDVQERTKVKPGDPVVESTEADRKPTPNEDSINQGVVHAQMYAMADKYLVPTLKEYSKERFRSIISGQYERKLAESVAEAYTTTPASDRGLRDVVLASTTTRIARLTDDTAFSQLAVDVPCFGYELLQMTVARLRTKGVTWDQGSRMQ